MADITSSLPTADQAELPGATPSDGTIKPDSAPESIPYSRFQEVNAEAKRAKAELEKLQTAELKRQEEAKKNAERQLASEARWQELATQRESERDTAAAQVATMQETVTAYEAALTKVYEGRVTAVPEIYRPLLSQLPLPERMTWIAENESLLLANGKTPPGGIPATPNPKGAGALTDEERRKRAARTF